MWVLGIKLGSPYSPNYLASPQEVFWRTRLISATHDNGFQNKQGTTPRPQDPLVFADYVSRVLSLLSVTLQEMQTQL